MNTIKFEFNGSHLQDSTKIEVIKNGQTVGTLEQGYEIYGPYQDKQQWIFWDNDQQEGVTYGTSLGEALNTIQSELEES